MVATRQSHQQDETGDLFTRLKALDLSTEKTQLLNKAQALCVKSDNQKRHKSPVAL